MTHHDDTARLRRLVYALLLCVVAGMAIGRIFAVERVNEPSLHKPDKADPRPLSDVGKALRAPRSGWRTCSRGGRKAAARTLSIWRGSSGGPMDLGA